MNKAPVYSLGKNQQYKQIRFKLFWQYTFWNPWLLIFVFFGGAKTVRKTSVGKNLRCKKWCCTVLIIHKSASWTMNHGPWLMIPSKPLLIGAVYWKYLRTQLLSAIPSIKHAYPAITIITSEISSKWRIIFFKIPILNLCANSHKILEQLTQNKHSKFIWISIEWLIIGAYECNYASIWHNSFSNPNFD